MDTARSSDRHRRTTTALTVTVATGVAYTVLTRVAPATQVSIASPDLRVVTEVLGLCFVLFAALVLALPGESDVRPARDAFVGALVVLTLVNAVFAVGPFVASVRLEVDRGLAFYPWIAARYLSGLLFVAAGLERPRLGLARMLWAALALLAVVELALVAAGDRLPVPVTISADDQITVVAPLTHFLLEAVPGALFGVGAWLAQRLFRRGAPQLYLWLALALAVLALAQVHEILYPAILGPVITSADLLRVTAFTMLLAGALLQLRWLYLRRSRAVRVQEQDLRRHDQLVDELTSFAAAEADFRAVVAHELATPIAAIRAFSHVLRSGAGEAQRERAVAGIDTEARRLTELVARMDELRDLELAEFRCELRPIRIVAIVREAVRFLEGLPGNHPLTLRCADERVLADPVRLGQLLRNVLSNAARYSPAHTPIEIAGDVDGERFCLRVTDAGPGIVPEERTRVLSRYARGRAARGTEGAGLGLYVARRIAEAHGGSLRLHPGADGGTVVAVDLRVAS